MTQKNVEKDAVIFQEGDTPDVAYCVVSGKVQLYQSDRGQNSTIRTVSENEVFGELAIFDALALRPYSAKALEACTIVAITVEEFKAVTDKAPQPVQALLTMMGERMKMGKVKSKPKAEMAINTNIKSIKIAPHGERLKSAFKPVSVPLSNLPYRIGGYPEGGESNKRDMVHLSIAAQPTPLRISRQHCEIAIEEGALVVVDLGSRFGTKVNDTIIGRGYGLYSTPLATGNNTVTLGNAEDNYTLAVTCE